jgi:hypothetical protein
MSEQATLDGAHSGARSVGHIGGVPTVVLALTRASLTHQHDDSLCSQLYFSVANFILRGHNCTRQIKLVTKPHPGLGLNSGFVAIFVMSMQKIKLVTRALTGAGGRDDMKNTVGH